MEAPPDGGNQMTEQKKGPLRGGAPGLRDQLNRAAMNSSVVISATGSAEGKETRQAEAKRVEVEAGITVSAMTRSGSVTVKAVPMGPAELAEKLVICLVVC